MKIFLNVCSTCAAVIGAGLATGKEVFVFFSESNPVALFVCVFAFFALFFFETADFCAANDCSTVENVFEKLLKNKIVVYRIVAVFVCSVMCVSMFAAANELFCTVFQIENKLPSFSICVAILVALALKFQKNSINLLSTITVPAVVVFVALTCFLKPTAQPNVSCFSAVPFVTAALYCAFNTSTSFAVIASQSKQTARKEIFLTSVVSALLLATICTVVFVRTPEVYRDKAMPLLCAAKEKGLFGFGIATICLSLLTTLNANALPIYQLAQKLTRDDFLALTLTLAPTLALSMLGFEKIVEICYPLAALLCVGGLLAVCFANGKRRFLTLKSVRLLKNDLHKTD